MPKGRIGWTDTRETSYRLYKEGNDIEEIAKRRWLKTSTVEGHLAHYVATGKLDVTDFVGREKISTVAAVLAENGGQSLSLVKEQLGDEVSYRELRMVRAYLARGSIRIPRAWPGRWGG